MRKVIGSTILLVLAVAMAHAQASPVAITKSGNTYTFKNVSKKTITLVVADQNWAANHITGGVVDFLFQERGFAPGDTYDQPSNSKSVTLTFVQFSDGTTWGTSSGESAQEALAKRKAILAYLPSLANAADETEFTAALNQPQTDEKVKLIQKMYQMDVASSGASVAWNAAKLRWSVAQLRTNLWNF